MNPPSGVQRRGLDRAGVKAYTTHGTIRHDPHIPESHFVEAH